jgi:drug/metabolite transporter (DMT)-like permease
MFALVGVSAIVFVERAPLPGGSWAPYAALAGLGIAVALGGLYAGLARGKMGVVAPVAATGAVIPLLVGLASGERPGVLPMVGIGFALIGLVLVSRRETAANVDPHRGTGLSLALLAAAGFGAAFVGLDRAAEVDVRWTIFGSRACFLLLVILAVAALRPTIRVAGSDVPPLAAIGLLDLGAITALTLATTKGLLSIVSVLASFAPMVTLIIARVMLDERLSRNQGVGVAVTLVGVALITSG